jgi:hypothetical protein
MPVFGPGGAIVAALGIIVTDPGRVRAMFAPVSVAHGASPGNSLPPVRPRCSSSRWWAASRGATSAAVETLRSDVTAG